MKATANTAQIKQRAEEIYRITRVDEKVINAYGESYLKPINKATIEEIENWLAIIVEAAKDHEIPEMDEGKIEFTATREEIFGIAAAKQKNYKNRAGVRALESKYGHEGAKRIVQKYSGRTIR